MLIAISRRDQLRTKTLLAHNTHAIITKTHLHFTHCEANAIAHTYN